MALEIASAGSGYRVVPRRRPRGATLRVVTTVPQPAAPAPGPSLEVQLAHGGRAFAARMVVRLVE